MRLQIQFNASYADEPSINKTPIEDMIAKGYDIAIIARAIDLPKILMVGSIAKTTKGNENADQVSLKFKILWE